MNSSFFFSSCVVPICFFTLFGTIVFMFLKKIRFHQENKTIASSSSLSLPSSLSCNRKHHVFPSFHGADVRKAFLSHILKEFRSKGIDPFIDNDIKRSKSIGPELIQSIRGSRIAIVLLSRNYCSSSWCLNELVEIMKCREELGQIVMTIFYEVDPTDIKKQTGDFGKVFTKTCKGKTKKEITEWTKALDGVATIAGEHSRNWDNEAAMIEKIATDVSNMLNKSTPSRDFDGLVGMGAHMEKMEPLLRLDLEDEVRMIGIWGPSGIGKTTIARFMFHKLSGSFQLTVFMENIKGLMYTRPLCSDDYNAKLHFQKQFMSQITNHMDIEIPHLGIVEDRLKDKKVLIVLDCVVQSIQLDAIAKDTRWFGLGSRIIITTQDQKLLEAHGINQIYKVDFPSTYEACQIFCMNAFGQKFPEDGFEELTWQVTNLVGTLPLGLRVMGSYFRGMSKQKWINALPRLRTSLDASIQSILKFSYDALCDEDKDLFLHIACVFDLFNGGNIEKLIGHLAHKSLDVTQGLHVLAEKSLISLNKEWRNYEMHTLLVQLGKEIVRHEPRKHQFLVDAREICEVLTDDTGSESVISIHFDSIELSDDFNISERAFEKMSNLKFLKFKCPYGVWRNKLHLPQGLHYLPRKLRLLEWDHFPMTSLPSNFYTDYLVQLKMRDSKLQKLWEGNQPLGNLKWMDLSDSKNLKELPDLSSSTKLQELRLISCSSLVKLPSCIGNATNLELMEFVECSSLVELPSWIGDAINLFLLHLRGCSSLVELPSSIGNATNLRYLSLSMCTSLVELPSSIGNLHKLGQLNLRGCSKLEILPSNINLESLEELDLTDCLLLKSFPDISTKIKDLRLMRTAIKEVPLSIRSWSRLLYLGMAYNGNLEELPHVLDIITGLDMNNTEMQEIPSWVKKISCLSTISLRGCKKLVSIPQLHDSLLGLNASKCESLERLDCSFNNPNISLNFVNCFKLNKEARELIIQTRSKWAILPGREVPANFTHRTDSGNSMRVNLNQRPRSTTSRFKACILVSEVEAVNATNEMKVGYRIMDLGVVVPCRPKYQFLPGPLTEHLYTFEFEADVTSNELFFEFSVRAEEAVIKACGLLQL